MNYAAPGQPHCPDCNCWLSVGTQPGTLCQDCAYRLEIRAREIGREVVADMRQRDRMRFDTYEDAFSYCREVNTPLLVEIGNGTTVETAKLYPSGRAEVRSRDLEAHQRRIIADMQRRQEEQDCERR